MEPGAKFFAYRNFFFRAMAKHSVVLGPKYTRCVQDISVAQVLSLDTWNDYFLAGFILIKIHGADVQLEYFRSSFIQ